MLTRRHRTYDVHLPPSSELSCGAGIPYNRHMTAPLIAPPRFSSIQEHVSHLRDVEFWRPYVSEILERHDLTAAGQELVPGFNTTYPTFIYGAIVVKIFGYSQSWREHYLTEREAQAVLATDPVIAAPRLLADGWLFDNPDTPWPYLVTTRMSGTALRDAGLDSQQWLSIATDLGRQIRRVHALPTSNVATYQGWPPLDVSTAAAASSLPAHLIAQVDDYLARLGPFDSVFVHSDIVANHVFVKGGHLIGIIDWSDAIIVDRHYELAKLHLDLFKCDKALLRAFLVASDWPMSSDFPHKALGLTLYFQAVGFVEDPTMDVFHMLPGLLPLQDIATLDDLAAVLFAV